MRTVGGVVMLGMLVVSGSPRAEAPPPAAVLVVPKVATPIPINAEPSGKRAWDAAAGITRNFKDAGGRGMVPYSEPKVRWGDGVLYLLLYAGDRDLEGRVRKRDGALEGDDSFRLEFGR